VGGTKRGIGEMTLGQKQRKFTEMIGRLIEWAYANGYELTFGDAQATTGHMKGSLHYSRLAVDFNLFKDGKWLSRSEDHKPLGEYWESIGGAWGGRFNDGNHYSLEHEGRK
jgi:hypothetical protein